MHMHMHLYTCKGRAVYLWDIGGGYYEHKWLNT